MLIPIYGFIEGDTLGLLILAHDTDTMVQLAGRMKRSAAPRVVIEGSVFVEYKGVRLPPGETLARAGIQPLCRVDLRKVGNDGEVKHAT